MTRQDERSGRRALVSNASTLVLSGFLIAAAVIEFTADDVGVYVLACGLIGLLGYVALETAKEERSRTEIAAREEEAFRRLNRHLTTPIAPVPLEIDGDPLGELFSSGSESPSSTAGLNSSPGRPQAG